MEVTLQLGDPDIQARVFAAGTDEMAEALHNADKLSAWPAFKQSRTRSSPRSSRPKRGRRARQGHQGLPQEAREEDDRKMVLRRGRSAADGRKARRGPPDHDRRPAICRKPTARGLFTRGQTAGPERLTLGMLSECSASTPSTSPRASATCTHYNFPAVFPPARPASCRPEARDIGHGALAGARLLPVIPAEDVFPVHEPHRLLRSSSQMGSSSWVRSAVRRWPSWTAGVAIANPVSGIAMGLIKEGETSPSSPISKVSRTFLGDMDFKVAGTENGITAMQDGHKARVCPSTSFAEHCCRPRKAARSSLQDDGVDSEFSRGDEQVRARAFTRSRSRPTRSATSSASVARSSVIQEETGARSTSRKTARSTFASRDLGGERSGPPHPRHRQGARDRREYHGRVVSAKRSVPSSSSSPARTACCTSAESPRAASTRSRTSLNVGRRKSHVKIIDIDDRGKVSLDRPRPSRKRPRGLPARATSQRRPHRGTASRGGGRRRGDRGRQPRRQALGRER